MNHSRLTTEKMSVLGAHDSAKPERPSGRAAITPKIGCSASHDRTRHHQTTPDQSIGPSVASLERRNCVPRKANGMPPIQRANHRTKPRGNLSVSIVTAPGSSRSVALYRPPRLDRPETTSARMYLGSQVHDEAADAPD